MPKAGSEALSTPGLTCPSFTAGNTCLERPGGSMRFDVRSVAPGLEASQLLLLVPARCVEDLPRDTRCVLLCEVHRQRYGEDVDGQAREEGARLAGRDETRAESW